MHALARHVARDGRVVGLARDLVDLVDVDDGALGLFDFIVAVLQQLLNDVFDVFTHVARFGQRGGVGHDERHVQHASQRLGQERLAGAGGPDQHDVALGELDFVALDLAVANALVVVVDGHGQHALGRRLPNDVLVEESLDFSRSGQLGTNRRARGGLRLFADDVVAQVDAFIADEYRRTRDQLADFVLAFIAKRAMQHLSVCRSLFFRHISFVSQVKMRQAGYMA